MYKKLKVAVVYGGKSGEHEVSILSASSIIENIDKSKYEIKEIFIDKKGNWFVSRSRSSVSESLGGVDIAFPVLHGSYGEDGTIQGLFEMIGLPYVGAGVSASSVGMDKDLMKKIFRAEGISTPTHLIFSRKEIKKTISLVTSRVEEELKYPLFTKPTNLGSSVGISKVKNKKELVEGLELASKYDRKIIVEGAIKNVREIEVSVLGNDDPKTSVCGEIVPYKEFYDYEDKYTLGKTKLIIPAKIPNSTSKKIKEMAKKSFKAIDCSGMARVDFLLEKNTNKIFVNEINTIPGFTKISMYPKLWEASGLSYSKLIDELIGLALERYNERGKNRT